MKSGFYIGILWLFLFSVISGIRMLIVQHKLYEYLRTKHAEKWKYLTTVLGFGPGFANGLKGLKFVFGKDDLGDPEILRLKTIVRNSAIYTVTGMFGTFIIFCISVKFHASH